MRDDKLSEVGVDDMELFVLSAIQAHKLISRNDLLGIIYSEFVYDAEDDQYFNEHINGLVVRLIEEEKVKEIEMVFSSYPDMITSFLTPTGTLIID